MANIYTYWDDTTKELINFTHSALISKGNRIEIALDDTHAVFDNEDPHTNYQMNDTSDDVELK